MTKKGVKKREFKGKVKPCLSRCQQLTHRLRPLLVNGYLLWATAIKKAIKFLLFEEDDPKHSVAINLNPIHCLLAFYLCFLAPAAIFIVTFKYGIIATILAELGLVLGILEAMHIAFDR